MITKGLCRTERVTMRYSLLYTSKYGVKMKVSAKRQITDDKTQAKKAARIITADKKALVTDVVITETIWMLTGKRSGVH